MRARVATMVLILSCARASCLDSRHIVFTIVSQPDPHHAALASQLQQDIEKQIFELEQRPAKVHLTHTEYPVPGAWTIIPLLRSLVARYNGTDVRWMMFLEDQTVIRCAKLFHTLRRYDDKPDVTWIGYPLRDEEPTIVHHFKVYEELEEDGGLMYPNFASGFAMRLPLVTLLSTIESGLRLEADFSIDPAFELAQLVYETSRGPGQLLTPDLGFCAVPGENCATYPKHFDICGRPVAESSILFAVKTWSGFHGTRAKVVNKTWGRRVTHLVFFSDVADPSVPTESIGIPNTPTGHCEKTVAILDRAVRKARFLPDVKWIFLADDDTILGVQRLCEVLSCYRGGANVSVIGQRFGYGYLQTDTAHKGYDYITGGGGIAFSVGAAAALAACQCAPGAADDMLIGACADARHIALIHSPLFHQARPQDYPREALSSRPVSFHGHSGTEPGRVYATWFQRDDLALTHRDRQREEL